QRTHNPLVPGSSPGGPTVSELLVHLAGLRREIGSKVCPHVADRTLRHLLHALPIWMYVTSPSGPCAKSSPNVRPNSFCTLKRTPTPAVDTLFFPVIPLMSACAVPTPPNARTSQRALTGQRYSASIEATC